VLVGGTRGPRQQGGVYYGFKDSNKSSEFPLTEIALEAFRDQIELAVRGPAFFQVHKEPTEHPAGFQDDAAKNTLTCGVTALEAFRPACPPLPRGCVRRSHNFFDRAEAKVFQEVSQ
jgi:hypothetical protein